MLTKPKPRKEFECILCGYKQSKWFGRCPSCGEYCNPVEREVPAKRWKQLESKKPIRTKRPVCNSQKQLFSIFTDDLETCVITGCKSKGLYGVHIHHVFGGPNRSKSEKYGFIVPLRYDYHDMSDYGIHFNRKMDLEYKKLCQEYWLANIGTKEEFIKIFGMWW
jgi:hypothetical protein